MGQDGIPISIAIIVASAILGAVFLVGIILFKVIA